MTERFPSPPPSLPPPPWIQILYVNLRARPERCTAARNGKRMLARAGGGTFAPNRLANVTCETLLPDALRKTRQAERRLAAVQSGPEGSLLASRRQEHEFLQDRQVQWRLPGRWVTSRPSPYRRRENAVSRRREPALRDL